MGTLVVAVAAAIFAGSQVLELRRSRREQTRPYVAVYYEVTDTTLFLVVKNFGTTTARNVRVTPNTPMRRSFKIGDEHETLKLFDELPAMVPGQEWRTFFDVGIGRVNADLNEVYKVTASYRDSRGKRLRDDTFLLDWTTFLNIEFVGTKTVNDIGKSLEKIESTLTSWTDGIRGLSVISRDGDASDERRRLDYVKRGLISDENNVPNDTTGS
jgi:hypothetical protein